jgi:hypothetical protein
MTTNAQTDRLAVNDGVGSQLFTAAWMAVALGFGLEALIALGAFALGPGTSPSAFLVNVGQRVSWGTLVCVGLAFAKAFKPKDPGAAAWAGMLSAPLAFTLARSAHKGLASAMGLSVAAAAPAVLVLLGTLKALEYGVLGAALARHDEREGASVGSYVRTGTWVGVLFGGAALAALALLSPKPSSAADWFARGVNEVLFPIGCSLILFAASATGRRLS